jgi:hypothetical protein
LVALLDVVELVGGGNDFLTKKLSTGAISGGNRTNTQPIHIIEFWKLLAMRIDLVLNPVATLKRQLHTPQAKSQLYFTLCTWSRDCNIKITLPY